MQLRINVKQAGKKHPLITDKIIEIADIGHTPTVHELLNAIVAQQVQEYNEKPLEQHLLPFLDKGTIEDNAATGKVGFGSIYNEKKAVLADAQEAASQAFEDGMFVLFADEQEHNKLGDIVSLTDNTILTFVRLTFLAGSYW
jgi:hypothetical protein